MFEIITSLFSLLQTIIYGFIKTLFLPFDLLLALVSLIYRIIFFFQIYMSSMCTALFGDGFGCKVIHPDYIFIDVMKYLILWSAIFYLGLKTHEAWCIWKTKKKRKKK